MVSNTIPQEFLAPVSWEDFKSLSRELQISYLLYLYERFHVSLGTISQQLFKVDGRTVSSFLRRSNIKYLKARMSPEEKVAWHKYLAADQKAVQRELRYHEIIRLWKDGASFNGISRELKVSASFASVVCRVYDAVETDNYEGLTHNSMFCNNASLFKWVAQKLGKSVDEVMAKFDLLKSADYSRRKLGKRVTIPPGIVEEHEAEPTTAAPVAVERTPQTDDTKELLRELNENLGFFRRLFTGGMVPTPA